MIQLQAFRARGLPSPLLRLKNAQSMPYLAGLVAVQLYLQKLRYLHKKLLLVQTLVSELLARRHFGATYNI